MLNTELMIRGLDKKPNAQRTLYNIDNVKKYLEATGNKNIIICKVRWMSLHFMKLV